MTGRRVRVVQAGGPRNWTRELNRRRRGTTNSPNWEPNTIYRVHNGRANSNYVYMTDQHGRVIRAEGQLVLRSGVRHGGQQGRAGHGAGRGVGNPGDEGGHLFGTQFGGAGEGINMLPQSAQLNSRGRREWYNMEQMWANELRGGNQVHVRINPVYTGPGERPDLYVVEYTITRPNGTTETVPRVFRNR
ncbi:DNA/RNA non-specific endonuclease [Actinopolymorpha alba]|uniref:DNA/RNA non-specific endonuclease n=1 Tax=Actinopolymorpha alba TaxID=533267 RepID=UPI0012F6459C|nr:DNA/RNA non-specific endonuclease [Actinopolymorpha alba]